MNGMIAHHAEMASRLGEGLGLEPETLAALAACYEMWDGRGWPGALADGGPVLPVQGWSGITVPGSPYSYVALAGEHRTTLIKRLDTRRGGTGARSDEVDGHSLVTSHCVTGIAGRQPVNLPNASPW